jgi:hypothetical protein
MRHALVPSGNYVTTQAIYTCPLRNEIRCRMTLFEVRIAVILFLETPPLFY